MFYKSPTYNLDTQEWSHTDFADRKAIISFLDSHFKYPGEYNLKYSEGFWNKEGRKWERTKNYCSHREGSLEFRRYWDFEKEKCRFDGFIIYKSEKEGLEFVVPSLFYWYLNYCPILDKRKKRNDVLPELYDGDLHYFLYILRALWKRKFAVILKKRQSGYTLKNMAIMLNCIWFGKGAIAKIFSQAESKVLDSWGFMVTYKEHINRYCGWHRNFDPASALNWEIKTKRNDGSLAGNRSVAKGFTTKQDPTNGVGGNADVIFGEEAGINSSLAKTHEFITSNVSLGGITTGLIIYSGAVGELDKCEDLKAFILNPDKDGFLGCENNIEDDKEFGESVGFFAPEWWNYVSVETDENDEPVGEELKCFDEWGNTNKQVALREVMKWRKKAESKDPEKYRYYCSQRPLSIREAFAFRKDSKFPAHLVQKQIQRIKDKEYSLEYVDLVQESNGNIRFDKSSKLPISEFPLSPKTPNKEGVLVVHERPIKNPELGKTYYASIDPIKVGKSNTSKSLCAIYVYKNDIEVSRVKGGETEVSIEPGKLVAWWCGRYDDPNDTYRQLELIMEAYKAWTVIENNVTGFIQYMQGRRKQMYLVPKSQIMFLKDISANQNVYQEYGWTNVGNIFTGHMLQYGVDSVSEQISQELTTEGDVVRVVYGVERITDIMLLKEMEAYHDNLNVDRIVAFCALMAFVKIQQANRGFAKRVEYLDSAYKGDPDLYKKQASFFKNMSSSRNVPEQFRIQKGLFKNMK